MNKKLHVIAKDQLKLIAGGDKPEIHSTNNGNVNISVPLPLPKPIPPSIAVVPSVTIDPKNGHVTGGGASVIWHFG